MRIGRFDLGPKAVFRLRAVSERISKLLIESETTGWLWLPGKIKASV